MTTEGAEEELSRAAALIDLGRYQEAADRAQAVLASDPDSARAGVVLAQAALGLGDHQRAFDAARRAASLAPQWWWPHHLMSVASSRAGDRGQAIDSAGEALRLAPGEYQAQLRLAEALLADGRPAQARPFVERALELAPNAVGPHYLAGRLSHAEGRRDDAARAFEKALSVDPNHAPSHNELARLRLGTGRGNAFRAAALADAAAGFATGVQADPRNEAIRRNLDVTIVAFLGMTAYFVFLADFVGFRVATGSNSSFSKDLPLILLALPVIYAIRFVARLQPQLRRFVLDLVIHRPAVRTPMILLAAAVPMIIAEVVVSVGPRGVFAALAFWFALVSRFLLWRHKRDIRGIRRPSRLRIGMARLVGREVPQFQPPPRQEPIRYRGRALARRRTVRVVAALFVAILIYGILESHQRSGGVAIAGIPGYRTLSGSAGYPLPLGRPWGVSCQPIRIAVDTSVPDWVYRQTSSAVAQARRQDIDITIAERNFDSRVDSLYYEGSQRPGTAITVPLSFSYGTPPSDDHITLNWWTRTDPDGHNEDLARADGTIWAQAVGRSSRLVQRSVRQLIALTQGILRSSNPRSAISDENDAEGFTQADVRAMLRMSGCSA